MTVDPSASTVEAEPRGERGRTIGRLWRDAVASDPQAAAYLVETDTGWEPTTLGEAGLAVDELACGLLSLGVGKADVVAIIGRTTLEWTLFDFALARIGAVSVPVYPSSSARDTRYIVEHSESVGVLCEDEHQLDKVSEARLDHRLTYDGLEALREQGRAFSSEHPNALERAESAVGQDDLFTCIYTSGTTGPPKGCMIRHRHYVEMCEIVARIESFLISRDVVLLFLPLAHTFGRLIHLLGPRLGFTIAFCPDPLRVAQVLPIVRPTVLPAVPRVFEKVHTAVSGAFAESTGIRRRLVDFALRVGREASELRQDGKPLPRRLAIQHQLADRLVYSKVKARLGGRVRLTVCGGAPLAREVAEFFHALDILILEGYGLTECTTACAVNRPDRYRFGSVGPAMPGLELATADDGELLVRGPTVFAGYLKDAEATREVLGDDGWLRTGDVGSIDGDGFVTITDRKKDIIVTAGGKNVAPQNLENDLKRSRFVSQALVVGDRRPYVAALLTLDEPEIVAWARARGLSTGLAELAEHEDVRRLAEEAVAAANEGRSRFEQVRRFAILPRDFTLEENEITPTLKLRRRACEAHFAAEIERLYAGPERL